MVSDDVVEDDTVVNRNGYKVAVSNPLTLATQHRNGERLTAWRCVFTGRKPAA